MLVGIVVVLFPDERNPIYTYLSLLVGITKYTTLDIGLITWTNGFQRTECLNTPQFGVSLTTSAMGEM